MSCYICNDATTVAVARAIKKFHMQGDVFDENMSVTEIANELDNMQNLDEGLDLEM